MGRQLEFGVLQVQALIVATSSQAPLISKTFEVRICLSVLVEEFCGGLSMRRSHAARHR